MIGKSHGRIPPWAQRQARGPLKETSVSTVTPNASEHGQLGLESLSIMSPELKNSIFHAQIAVSHGSLSKAFSILSSHGVAPNTRDKSRPLAQLILVCPAAEDEEFIEKSHESLASAFPATFTGHRICSREQVSKVNDKLDNSTSSCAS